jgi:linoleoyl-CoA desaturase
VRELDRLLRSTAGPQPVFVVYFRFAAPVQGGTSCSTEQVRDSQLRFDVRTPFSRALEQRVETYFQQTGQSRRGGIRMLGKTAILFAWLFAAYAGLLLFGGGSWLAVVGFGIACGLATAGLGMAVQHDGGHRAYSERPAINRMMAAVLDLLGASSYVWRVKHGIIHHTYTNIEGIDDDIDAAPFARLAPGQPHHRLHRFQHFYMWPLYGFLTAKWFLVDDFRNLAQGKIGGHPLRRPRGLDLGIFVVGKLVHFCWALIIPIVLLGLGKTAIFYVAMSGACGLTLAVVFQLAHCVEEAEFPLPSSLSSSLSDGERPLDFAAHQLATTVDFARDNALLGWYVGGLNFQAVHHLYPRICHLHYPALAKIVEQTAAEHDVRYTAIPGLGTALRSHYRWLRRMGAGERHHHIAVSA